MIQSFSSLSGNDFLHGDINSNSQRRLFLPDKLKLAVMLAGLMAGAMFSGSTVRAATLTKADTTTMNAAADWGGTAPAAGNTGQFDATISAPNEANLTLGGAVALDGLTFLGTMNGPVTVATSASTLTLGTSAGINMSAANFDVTINCPVSVQFFNVPVGRTITLGGGSAALFSATTSTGLGTVQLTAASAKTFTTSGATQPINLGTPSTGAGGLVIGNNCTVNSATTFEPGTSGNGLVTINGGTLNLTGGSLVVGRSASGNGRLILVNGAITTGANQAIIGFSSAASGELDVQGGLFSSAGANVVVNTATSTSGLLSISGGVTLAKDIDFGGGFNTASSSGKGILLMSGGSLYVGTGGIIQDGTGSFTSLTRLSGGTVFAAANWSSLLPMTLTNDTGNITFNTADTNGNPFNITLAGVLAGPGGLNKTGGGTLNLSGANTYTSNTVISAGTLNVQTAAASSQTVTTLGLSSALTTGFTRPTPTLTTAFSTGNVVSQLIVSSATGITPSAVVTGTGIPAGVTVSSSYTPGNTTVPLTASFTATANSTGNYTFSQVVTSVAVANASTIGIAAGQEIVGTGIPAGITVSSVSGTTVNVASFTCTAASSGNYSFFKNSTTATFSSGVSSITVGSATGIAIGELVSGAGIAAGTVVTSVSGTTIGVSPNTTATQSAGTQYTFGGISQILTTSSSGLIFGQPVSGTGIPASAVVGLISNNVVNLVPVSGAVIFNSQIGTPTATFAAVNASITSSVTNSIAAGATLDVSTISSYAFGAGQTLIASGTGSTVGTTAAAIKGASGGTVSLGSQPVILTYDGSNPALYISQGTLVLTGNAITVNKAVPLSVGTYTIIQQASGNITQSGSYTVTGTAIPGGASGAISFSGGNVILTITSTAAATTTTLGSLTTINYGDTATLMATVSPTPDGGTVQFFDNGVAVGSPVAVNTGTGVASLNWSAFNAGSHPISAFFGGTVNFAASTSGTSTQTVNQLPVTIVSGLSIADKTWDGTTTARLITNNVVLSGVLAGDTANVVLSTNGYSANFASSDIGSGISVTVSGLTFGGSAGANYSATPPSGLTGNILIPALASLT